MYQYCEATVQRTTPSTFSVSAKTKVQNHHTKFKKKIVPRKQYRIRKSTTFEKDCTNVFNSLPNDIHLEKSFSTFKDKSCTICLD